MTKENTTQDDLVPLKYTGWYLQRNGHYYGYSKEHLAYVIHEPMNHFFKESPIYESPFYIVSRCGHCGKELNPTYDSEKKIVSIPGDPCEFPKGLFENVVELNVPSGKIVFDNDLREWFRVIGFQDVNISHGLKACMDDFARIGMAHGYVGNTCPDIFQANDQNIAIASLYKDSNDDNYERISEFHEQDLYWNRVSNISTDLWWYSAVDYDDFKRRYDEDDFDSYVKKCTVVTVKPGVYRFHHFFRNSDESDSKFDARISWIREPDLNDTRFEDWKREDYTIGQVFLNSMISYPGLYFPEECKKLLKDFCGYSLEEKIRCIQNIPKEKLQFSVFRFALQKFWSHYQKEDWHPNGWTSGKPMIHNLPDMELPRLCGPFPWCHRYGRGVLENIVNGNIRLNKSFLAFAFDSLYSIVKYGTSDEDGSKETIRVSRDYFTRLSKMYPDDVPSYTMIFQIAPKRS